MLSSTPLSVSPIQDMMRESIMLYLISYAPPKFLRRANDNA